MRFPKLEKAKEERLTDCINRMSVIPQINLRTAAGAGLVYPISTNRRDILTN